MLNYDRPVMDLIGTRRSWRSYRDELLPEETKDRIRSFISGLPEPPFGSKMRFIIAESDRSRGKRPQGTYGVIKGASCFLVGILDPAGRGLEDFGYLFQSIILYLTSLDLGTCWLGGTFDSSLFSGKADLQKGELIPAVSPVGFIAEKRTLLDNAFVFFVGSKKRKPWAELFFRNSFRNSLVQGDAGAYAQALEMVRLAPSASNKQPWRIVMKDGGFHFYLQRTPGYGKFVRTADLQRIDMGICMLHFQQTVHESGLTGKWEMHDPGIFELPEHTNYVVSWSP